MNLDEEHGHFGEAIRGLHRRLLELRKLVEIVLKVLYEQEGTILRRFEE